MWVQSTKAHGNIIGAFGVDEFKREVERRGSFFFTPDTMRWFGTRNVAVIDGVVVIGCDTKAPEGVDRYWARVFDEATGRPDKIVSADTRAKIIRQAHKIAKSLKE